MTDQPTRVAAMGAYALGRVMQCMGHREVILLGGTYRIVMTLMPVANATR